MIWLTHIVRIEFQMIEKFNLPVFAFMIPGFFEYYQKSLSMVSFSNFSCLTFNVLETFQTDFELDSQLNEVKRF